MKLSASELGLREQDFFLPKRCVKTLYSCLVHPYCHYCIIVWWSTYKTNLRRLVFLQKQVVWSPKNLTACLNSSSTSIKIHALHELFSHFTLHGNKFHIWREIPSDPLGQSTEHTIQQFARRKLLNSSAASSSSNSQPDTYTFSGTLN